MAWNIMIADDHAIVRQGLRTLLEQAGHRIISETDNGETACQLCRECKPDLLILDMDMPGMGGLETIKRLFSLETKAKILVYSMHDDVIHASRAMQAGARGYVAKSEAPGMLLDAIRAIMRGDRFVSADIAQHMAVNHLEDVENPIKTLSPREFEVFRRLANAESLQDIAENLHISPKSAANIQTQVRQKLNVSSLGQMMNLALRVGIVRNSD